MTSEQKESRSKVPEMSDLELKYLGENSAERVAPVRQNMNEQMKKLEDLINRLDEAAYGILKIRDTFIEEVNELELVATRTSKAFRIFEHQVDNFGRVHNDIIQHYQNEMKKIAENTVEKAAKELSQKASEEVQRHLRSEVGDLRYMATSFKESVANATKNLRDAYFWWTLCALGASLVGSITFYAITRIF